MPFVTVGHENASTVNIYYEDHGSGPPVVLIHGMLNTSRHWRGVVDRLADRHTLIAPDLIGHGESSKPSDGLHMKFPR